MHEVLACSGKARKECNMSLEVGSYSGDNFMICCVHASVHVHVCPNTHLQSASNSGAIFSYPSMDRVRRLLHLLNHALFCIDKVLVSMHSKGDNTHCGGHDSCLLWVTRFCAAVVSLSPVSYAHCMRLPLAILVYTYSYQLCVSLVHVHLYVSWSMLCLYLVNSILYV